MSDINTTRTDTTTGQVFGGLSGGSLFNLFGLGGGKSEPTGFFPAPGFELPTQDSALAREQLNVQNQIEAATAAGEQPSALLFTRLETIEAQRDLLNRQFLAEQERRPGFFAQPSVRIAPGTPLSHFIRLANEAVTIIANRLPVGPGQPSGPITTFQGQFVFSPTGEPIPRRSLLPPGAGGGGGGGGDPGAFSFPSRRAAPTAGPTTQPASRGFNINRFIQCLIASLLPNQGGQRMPFVTTPSFSGGTGSFDFGGFGGILQSGIQLASSILAPKAPQFTPTPFFPPAQQAGFPLLGAGAGALAKRFLPPFGAGVAGGIAENFLGFGGASTLDESAAFTDAIPGSCRPKMHVKTNPCTGKGVWFVPRGRPLVFSGDLSAAKRLDRVAKTLDKARPRRRHHHHPR